MYFYRKLRNFNVDSRFMKIFYSSFIESVLTFSFICWLGSLTLKNRNRLGHIVRICSKIAGLNLDELSLLFKTRATKKAQTILDDCTHPLFAEYKLLPSARRYALPRCRTNRLKNSFVPITAGLTAALRSNSSAIITLN